LPTRPIHTEFNEADLVARLMRREKEAVGELYDRYARALFGVVVRIVGAQEAAEDVLQEVFVQIWEKIDRYDPERGTLFTWICAIARNRALDVVKSRAHRDGLQNRSIDDVVESVNTEYVVSDQTDHIGIRETLDRLDPDLREVVDTLYFRGYTQSEAAEELSLPLGTLKTRARRAIQELRARLHVPQNDP
jgi:RNA polymerase sigma factor (sigma-70 family)